MSKDYTTGTPWLCSELEGNVTLETEVSLKDDFFLAVCKDRILSIEIPPGFAAGGTVSDLSFKNITDIKNMFLGEAPQGHDALLAFNLFKLYMDWEGRNARGVQPLKELTDAIEAIGTVDELIRFLVNTPEEKLPFYFWDARSVTDFGDSEKHILAVSWKGLLLEDSAEYRELSELGRAECDGRGAVRRSLCDGAAETAAAAWNIDGNALLGRVCGDDGKQLPYHRTELSAEADAEYAVCNETRRTDRSADVLLLRQHGDAVHPFVFCICGARFRYAADQTDRDGQLFTQQIGSHKAVAAVVAVSAEEQNLRTFMLLRDLHEMYGQLRTGALHHFIVADAGAVRVFLQLHHFERCDKSHVHPPDTVHRL